MLKKTPTLPKTPTDYPDGTFIETEKGYFYIVNDIKRFRIVSTRVLDSWRPPRVVKTTEAAVGKYRISSKMKFRNGSLIWNLSDAKIYLIENGKRRWLKTPDILEKLGVKESGEIICVSQSEIELHPEGEHLV